MNNDRISPYLIEFLMLPYEDFIINMRNRSSPIFNKRFCDLVKSAQILLKTIRLTRSISENEYQEALKQKAKDWIYSDFEALLELAIQPTSSQSEWLKKGVYRIT